MEGATLSLLTLHPDLPAHQRHQLRGDAKAQSRSTILSRRGIVGLPEGFKNQLLFVWRDADATVDHPEVQRHGFFGSRFRVHVNDHLALLGELDGVPHQIQEDLPQSTGVTQDGIGQFRADVRRNLQPFLMGAGSDRLESLLHAILEAELNLLQIQLPGFRFREVQEVVDDGHHRIG